MSKQYTICVTAGHDEKDSGAATKSTDGKLIKEADLTVKFRNAVLHYLQQDKSIVTRTDGYKKVNLPLREAIKLIKGSDIAVEFHLNASSNSKAFGIETISLPKDKVVSQQLSLAVADVFSSKLRGENGWIDQSQSHRGKLGYVSAGGLILELGFLSNEDELKAFEEKYWLAARKVAEILIDYVKSKK